MGLKLGTLLGFVSHFYERVNSLVRVPRLFGNSCAIRKDYHFRHYGSSCY